MKSPQKLLSQIYKTATKNHYILILVLRSKIVVLVFFLKLIINNSIEYGGSPLSSERHVNA